MAVISNRRAGLITLQIDGEVYEAKGSFSYNLGQNTREAILGADGVHGYKETPQVSFIEGAVTDRADLDLAALVKSDDVTVTLKLNNGKVITMAGAWFAGDGTASTEEAEIPVRFESKYKAQEV